MGKRSSREIWKWCVRPGQQGTFIQTIFPFDSTAVAEGIQPKKKKRREITNLFIIYSRQWFDQFSIHSYLNEYIPSCVSLYIYNMFCVCVCVRDSVGKCQSNTHRIMKGGEVCSWAAAASRSSYGYLILARGLLLVPHLSSRVAEIT